MEWDQRWGLALEALGVARFSALSFAFYVSGVFQDCWLGAKSIFLSDSNFQGSRLFRVKGCGKRLRAEGLGFRVGS